MFSEMLVKFFNRQFRVFEDGIEQTRSNSFTRVNRHHCPPAIRVLEDMMAAFDARYAKAEPLQGGNQLASAHSGQAWHGQTVMRCNPTNSEAKPRS